MNKINPKNISSVKNPVKRHFGGFTLIELLVVVLIIGILAAIALPQYVKSVEKATAMEAISNIRYLRDLEKMYYLANNTYTLDFEALGAELPFESDGKTIGKFEYMLSGGPMIRAKKKDNHYYILSWPSLDDGLFCYDEGGTTPANFCKTFSSVKETCPNPGWGQGCYRIK